MKELGLVPYFLDVRRLRKVSPSTYLSIYIGVMFLFSRLAVTVGNSFNDGLDNLYTFAAIMQNSICAISHSCFLFSTLLFLGEFVNSLHVLLSFKISIYFTLKSFDSNLHYVKAQISVLVPLNTLSAFLILSKFEMKKYPHFCLCIIMVFRFCQ